MCVDKYNNFIRSDKKRVISLLSFTCFHENLVTTNPLGTPDVILHILTKDHWCGCCSYRGLVNAHILRGNVCSDM